MVNFELIEVFSNLQGYSSCAAHEYEEDEDVFDKKMDLLCALINGSRNMIAYTGAGISTSSGIKDYASVSFESGSRVSIDAVSNDPYSATPSTAHKCLTAMYYTGHLKWWCQQNHGKGISIRRNPSL